MKKDLTKTLIDELYSTQRRKNFPTNKIFCNHIVEIWRIDLADEVDYKISKTKGFRYILIITEIFLEIYLGHTSQKQKIKENNKRIFKYSK